MKIIEATKGWKAFDKDLRCRGFQYAIGKTYKQDGNVKLCSAGFHFYKNIHDIFNFKGYGSRVCEVSAVGEYSEGEKSVTNEITILRELSGIEIDTLTDKGRFNSGDRNSGHRNSGNRNFGDRNTGDLNSGYRNSGNLNFGDMNSGDRNTGYRNSGDNNSGERNSGNLNSGNHNSGDMNSGNMNSGYLSISSGTSEHMVFDLPTEKEMQSYEWPIFFNFELCDFVEEKDMNEYEKEENPSHETVGGYLKTLGYKEAWRMSWEKADIEDKKKVLDIPNWDNRKFLQITGIDVERELSPELSGQIKKGRK